MIRPLRERDVERWAELRARLWPDADRADLSREARAFVEGPGLPNVTAVFVADDAESIPIAFLELALRPFSDGCDSMPVPHVEAWYVEPGARRAGLGRALMHAAETWARERGFSEIASDTEIGNSTSLLAHRGCGFDEVERLIKLRKPLAQPNRAGSTSP